MKKIMLDEDKEIRNYFANIVIPVPSNYDDFIQEKISQASEMNQQKAISNIRVARFKRAIILVAAIIVFIVGSTTVVAATGDSAHETRMLKLSEEETQRLLDNADKVKKEGWQTSRTMTEAEKERLNLLEKQYMEDVLIPQCSLVVVNDRSEIIKEKVCFYPNDNYFNFPEREMTDDELLQIVDYRMTTDYVLRQRMWENQPEGVIKFGWIDYKVP